MCPYLSKEKRIFANGFMGNIVNTMGATVFNPVQQHLLMMFAFDGSEERLKEVKTVLFQYFQKKMDERLDELWDAGVLDQRKLDELRTKHLRTELKE